MITAVVFDMDGLLFDTENLARISWIESADEMAITGIDEVYHHFIGLNRADGNALLSKMNGEDFPVLEFRKRATEIFNEKLERDGLPVKPGVKELLQWLKENRIKTAVASSSRREVVCSHLEKAGFLDYFQVIVGGDMVEHSKPEPDIYLKACRELGEEPSGVAAVEDSPNGIRAAARAGMIPLMVPDLVAPTEELKQLFHGSFNSLFEVKRFLGENICSPEYRKFN